MNDEPFVYTVPQLAKRWGVHKETISRMILRGDLKTFRIGNRHRITQETVSEHEREHCREMK